MPKGIDFIWAIEYSLDTERRTVNDLREAELRRVVEERLVDYGDPSVVSAGTQALLRFRTFNDVEIESAVDSLSVLFPGLSRLPRSIAVETVRDTVARVKDVSKSTFGTRTKISTILAVLRAAEPGYVERQAEHLLPADLPELERLGQKVRDFSIETEADFAEWLSQVWANFHECEASEDRARDKQFFPGTTSNTRMYQRNLKEWAQSEGRYELLRKIVESGESELFGQQRKRLLENRRNRPIIRSNSINAPRTPRDGVSGFVLSPAPAASLTVTIVSTTNLDQKASKTWTTIPAESILIRDWIQAIISIWGADSTDRGIKVSASIANPAGTSEVDFVANDADIARTKIMQFVTASI